MRQCISVEQWNMLSDNQKQSITPWLIGTGNLTTKHYSRFWTIGKCIEFIRLYHQMDIYTVNNNWCIQLFDFSVCANDEEDCIYEGSSTELIDILFDTVIWILERQEDR